MTERNSGTRSTKRVLLFAGAPTAVLLLAAGLGPLHTALAASSSEPVSAAAAAKAAAAEAPLLNALDGELKRAMSSLGTDGAAGEQQPKPYFLSYDVSDATQVAIAAQYGAIVNSNEGHRRVVDVQVRLGSPAEDNTHGDHRNSALTTFPLPLTDDPAAISRSLWFALPTAWVRPRSGWLPEGQDRAAGPREGGGCFGRLQRGEAADRPASPRPLAFVVNRAAWEQRLLREISSLFSQYPDVFADQVSFEGLE